MKCGFAQVLTFPATLPPGARLLEGGGGEVPRACPSALSLTPGLCAERKARRPQNVSPGERVEQTALCHLLPLRSSSGSQALI